MDASPQYDPQQNSPHNAFTRRVEQQIQEAVAQSPVPLEAQEITTSHKTMVALVLLGLYLLPPEKSCVHMIKIGRDSEPHILILSVDTELSTFAEQNEAGFGSLIGVLQGYLDEATKGMHPGRRIGAAIHFRSSEVRAVYHINDRHIRILRPDQYDLSQFPRRADVGTKVPRSKVVIGDGVVHLMPEIGE